MYLPKFEIDMAKCCFCADCVPPCPTDCIYMLPDYEYSTYDRKDLIFEFSNLSTEKRKELEEREKAKEEAKLAAEAAAAQEKKEGEKG